MDTNDVIKCKGKALHLTAIHIIGNASGTRCMTIYRDNIIKKMPPGTFTSDTMLKLPHFGTFTSDTELTFADGTHSSICSISEMIYEGQTEEGHFIFSVASQDEYERLPETLFLHIPGMERIAHARRLEGQDNKIVLHGKYMHFEPGTRITDAQLMFYCPVPCTPDASSRHNITGKVDLRHPECYHRDTARIVYEECLAKKKFPLPECKFIIAHGMAKPLLDAYSSATPQQRKSCFPEELCSEPLFDICTVIRAKLTRYDLYSLKDKKNKESIDMHTRAAESSLVLLENDGRIVIINNKLPFTI